MSDFSDFFAPLENTKPFMKACFEGFPGGGKTFTMANFAAGLHAHIGSTKPIVIFDTERAAKFLKPFFKSRGIEVLVKESKSLADLKKTMSFCRSGVTDILLIDSISHIWENFLQSYQERENKSRLSFADWGVIKPAWRAEFSEPYVNDPYHCLFTGRAAYEYDNEIDEETKKREIFKSGVKMRAEGETAYEPDLLVLMTRREDVVGRTKEVWREATVLKDRSALIDGKTFENPTFDVFKPVVEFVLDEASERRPGPEADAAALFKTEENKREWCRQRDIAIENIENYMIEVGYSGQQADAKKHKVAALTGAFGTASWTAITALSPKLLENGLVKIRAYVADRIADHERSFEPKKADPVRAVEPEKERESA